MVCFSGMGAVGRHGAAAGGVLSSSAAFAVAHLFRMAVVGLDGRLKRTTIRKLVFVWFLVGTHVHASRN